MEKKNKFIYLACPFSHQEEKVREERFNKANIAAAYLMSLGHVVFSPISHMHPIAKIANLPKEWDFWEKFDRVFLENSNELYVLDIDGWDKSTGVRAEIEIAKSLNLPIKLLLYEQVLAGYQNVVGVIKS
jgi:hypothetical protein